MDTFYAEKAKQTDDELAAESGSLGPNYYHAQAIAEKVMADFSEEHFQPFGKLVGDFVADKMWDMLRDSIISDTQYNISGEIHRRIDNAVLALLSGKPWALSKYVFDGVGQAYGDGAQVREKLVESITPELQDARIKDLEAQVSELKRQLEWRTR